MAKKAPVSKPGKKPFVPFGSKPAKPVKGKC
jgi:hypothetical protein